MVKVKFSLADCRPCARRADCAGPRARRRERTPEFARLYARRAGVEATSSQAVRGFGLRRSRYSGLAKTRLQHVATAAAMNLVRLVHWISGDPLATTRRSHLSRLINVQSAA